MTIVQLSNLGAFAAYKEVFADEIYFKHGITLNEGDCVFDVGANIGLFTLFTHQKCRNLQSYAFEPIPPTFEALETNINLYNLDVKLFPLGLSSKPETAEFTFYPEMSGLSGRYSEMSQDRKATKTIILQDLQVGIDNGANISEAEIDEFLATQFIAETHTCKLTTISNIINEHKVQKIDLLKIDVEKAEVDVLQGIQYKDWDKINQIVMEVDTRENLEKITIMLEQRGFELVVDNFVIVPETEPGNGVYIYMLYASKVGLVKAIAANQTTNQDVLSPGDLRTFLKQKLPEYMVPSAYVMMNVLPLTHNGKIDRRALPNPDNFRPELKVDYVAPKTELEELIATSWKEVLQIEKVGCHDNFFDLGGTSLLIVQARTRLKEKCNIDVSIVDMFQYPTIDSLAQYLSKTKENNTTFEKIRTTTEKQKIAQQKRAAQGRKAR
jgi:iturin family lipopeptide synthetase A